MKKLLFCISLLMLPGLGSSQTFFGPHVSLGYNDGFYSDYGFDLSFIGFQDGQGLGDMIKRYRAIQNFIGVEYDVIDGTRIVGPKYRIAGHASLFTMGIEAAYLRNGTEPKSYLVFRPQIGFAVLTIFTLNYTYNLSNNSDLYSSKISPHGFSIGFTFPLHDGDGWRF